MKPIILLYAVVLLIAGCAAPTQSISMKFEASDFEPFMTKGSGKISGQAFMKTRAGDVKFGAGCTVWLTPATAYMKELVRIKDQGFNVSNHTQDTAGAIQKYIRTTVADGTGNFEFNNLPPGEYFVECNVTWEFVGQFGLVTTGGLIRKKVELRDGEPLKVILTS